jgi:hypothetical protein
MASRRGLTLEGVLRQIRYHAEDAAATLPGCEASIAAAVYDWLDDWLVRDPVGAFNSPVFAQVYLRWCHSYEELTAPYPRCE